MYMYRFVCNYMYMYITSHHVTFRLLWTLTLTLTWYDMTWHAITVHYITHLHTSHKIRPIRCLENQISNHEFWIVLVAIFWFFRGGGSSYIGLRTYIDRFFEMLASRLLSISQIRSLRPNFMIIFRFQTISKKIKHRRRISRYPIGSDRTYIHTWDWTGLDSISLA